MDQAKVGKFIAQLRKEQGLTQEALGERLGVTNKTVSRWENGNYMPDIELLIPPFWLVVFCWLRNRMMAYVEGRVYGGPEPAAGSK